MTTIHKNWKTIAGISTSVVLFGSVLALLPMVIEDADAQVKRIPRGDLCVHYDKIIFEIKKDPSKKIPKELLKTELDIKVLDDPRSVADIQGKVKEFLSSGPYVDPSFQILDLTPEETANLKLKIIDVDYALDCNDDFIRGGLERPVAGVAKLP